MPSFCKWLYILCSTDFSFFPSTVRAGIRIRWTRTCLQLVGILEFFLDKSSLNLHIPTRGNYIWTKAAWKNKNQDVNQLVDQHTWHLICPSSLGLLPFLSYVKANKQTPWYWTMVGFFISFTKLDSCLTVFKRKRACLWYGKQILSVTSDCVPIVWCEV